MWAWPFPDETLPLPEWNVCEKVFNELKTLIWKVSSVERVRLGEERKWHTARGLADGWFLSSVSKGGDRGWVRLGSKADPHSEGRTDMASLIYVPTLNFVFGILNVCTHRILLVKNNTQSLGPFPTTRNSSKCPTGMISKVIAMRMMFTLTAPTTTNTTFF